MRLPPWAAFLVRCVAPPDRREDLLGDLEEVHRSRVESRGRGPAMILTTLEAIEIAAAAAVSRFRYPRAVPVSWIDFKLGLRMLVKYPGLTLVGGLAIAFGIFAGAGCYEFYSQVLHPRLPFDEGERVVDVGLMDDRTLAPERRLLHDLSVWRTELTSIEELGAALIQMPNLTIAGDRGEPILAAAMSGSAFHLTRVPPLMGRTLVESDESPSAPNVLVLGYDAWRTRFGEDPDVVGRTVLVGDTEHTIVGVMPEGFGFPRNEDLWLPLRVNPSLEPLRGPGVMVFGRLAPDATFDLARTQLETLVGSARVEQPALYEHLRPRVLPFAEAGGIRGLGDRLAVMSVNVFAGLFLILVCGNVALLMYARAAARESEIVVRSALGASRTRILSQLFSEALVLSAVAGFVGVSTAGYGLERFLLAYGDGNLPAFWYHTSLSPRTVVYAMLLTVLAALIAGVVPGHKITSGRADPRLRRMTAGGGGLRFGGLWTAIIVVQVAATVTFPAVGWAVRGQVTNTEDRDLGFAPERYLSARPLLNPPSAISSDSTEGTRYPMRFARTMELLKERLQTEVSVAGVTVTRFLPGRYHSWRRIEMDAGGEGLRGELDLKGPGWWVSGGMVPPDFFDELSVEVVQGRTFNANDVSPETRTVIVNQQFVNRVLGGRNPIGRRLRYLGSGDGWDGVELGDEAGPWYRIVGVVPDLAMNSGGSGLPTSAGFYHAVSFESLTASMLLVEVNGDPAAFANRLREIAAEVEPDLALLELQPLDLANERGRRAIGFWVWLIMIVSGVAILLSLAGIYAVMSFTVSRRTREIGVRVALGAGSARVAVAIFQRPVTQLAMGLLLGLLLSASLALDVDLHDPWGRPLVVLLSYGALMTAVCSLACVVPMRRALAVEPSEALASEG